jgi:hypothetical protein
MRCAAQTTMSFVNVFDMVLGAFEIETFRTAPYWMLSVSFFMLFMVFVNIVMLNALIAIMVRAMQLPIRTSCVLYIEVCQLRMSMCDSLP